MNGLLIILIITGAICFVAFLVIQNRKDQNEFEKEHNREDQKYQDDVWDIELEEEMK